MRRGSNRAVKRGDIDADASHFQPACPGAGMPLAAGHGDLGGDVAGRSRGWERGGGRDAAVTGVAATGVCVAGRAAAPGGRQCRGGRVRVLRGGPVRLAADPGGQGQGVPLCGFRPGSGPAGAGIAAL